MSGDQLQLPAGFRFHPTDEELVVHYLVRKCASQSISVPIIAEVDLYKYDPWQLPGIFFILFSLSFSDLETLSVRNPDLMIRIRFSEMGQLKFEINCIYQK